MVEVDGACGFKTANLVWGKKYVRDVCYLLLLLTAAADACLHYFTHAPLPHLLYVQDAVIDREAWRAPQGTALAVHRNVGAHLCVCVWGARTGGVGGGGGGGGRATGQ